MRQPTEYAEFTVTTGVYVASDTHISRLSQLFQQVDAVDSMLQRLRETKYADHESVFDVTVADAAAQISGPCLLPDQKLDLIEGVNAAQWDHTYRSVLYDRDRAGPADSLPDGRLDWQTALGTFRDTNTADPFVVEWATDAVTPTTVDGRPALDCPLGDGSTLRLFPASDVADVLDKFDEVRLAGYPERARQVMGAVTEREPPDALELSLGYDGRPPRYYVDREGPDSDRADTHASQLDQCEQLDEAARMDVLADFITEGYFMTSQQILYGLFLAGARDVIRVSYGYSVPCLIDRLAAVLDAHLTHLPQTGQVLLSREPLDAFDQFAAEFPEKQTLTDDEERAIRQHLDRPPEAIDFNLDDETWGVRATERLAQLFAADVVSVDDVYAYQFAEYSPPPTEEGLFEAIQRGRENLAALQDLDATYDIDLAGSIEASVDRFGDVSWT